MINYIKTLLLVMIIGCPATVLHLPSIHAQGNRDALVGVWEFQSMTTIHHSEPRQVEILYSGKNNNETLVFNQDNSFIYKNVSNGEHDNEAGSWNTENDQLIIDLEDDKTISKYKIQEDVLTIIIHDKKTDDYHAYDTVLEYKKTNQSMI